MASEIPKALLKEVFSTPMFGKLGPRRRGDYYKKKKRSGFARKMGLTENHRRMSSTPGEGENRKKGLREPKYKRIVTAHQKHTHKKKKKNDWEIFSTMTAKLGLSRRKPHKGNLG